MPAISLPFPFWGAISRKIWYNLMEAFITPLAVPGLNAFSVPKDRIRIHGFQLRQYFPPKRFSISITHRPNRLRPGRPCRVTRDGLGETALSRIVRLSAVRTKQLRIEREIFPKTTAFGALSLLRRRASDPGSASRANQTDFPVRTMCRAESSPQWAITPE